MKYLKTHDVAEDSGGEGTPWTCHICGKNAGWPHLWEIHNLIDADSLFPEPRFNGWAQKQRVIR